MAASEKLTSVTVGEFYTRHSEELRLELLGERIGFDRRIREPTINRPGLALAGFFTYFAEKRLQVLGSAELSYLKSLGDEEAVRRVRPFCEQPIPCIVVARGHRVPAALTLAAAENGIAIFSTTMVTMRFINAATLALEFDFSPRKGEYGSMVDIQGVGVLIRGSSGIGKSECVLGILERGYSLVSDDITQMRAVEGRELVGTSHERTRNYMEVRGLGVINVVSIFGVGAFRPEKRLDLVVTLKDWAEIDEIDRTGLEQELFTILDIHVPHVTIPVKMGRDLARLVEVAALDQKLKSLGTHSAIEFNEKLMLAMQKKRDA